MKNIIEYLDIEQINEVSGEKSAILAIKSLRTAMEKAIQEYVANHKPTDTVKDYIDAVSKTLESSLKSSLGNVFDNNKINELIKIFRASANRSVKTKGFRGTTLFDEFWKNK